MSDLSNSARDIYIAGLRDRHAVEHQAIELLERQVGRLENYPELRERMRSHIEESWEQARRLEVLLSEQATGTSSFKDAAMAFVGNMMALGHATASDEVVKNTLANFAFKHYEIAAYQSLLALADAVGHRAAKSALETSLKEEQAMADWIAAHIRPTTLRYLERASAGVTAGV